MAELFTHLDNQESYLLGRYRYELWERLLEHAPKCMDYLKTHGVAAWLERYGLPKTLRDWAEDYHADPEGYVAMGWDYGDTPPLTLRLVWHWEPFPDYDPSRMPAHRWRERAIAWLDCYMQTVEEAYSREGWTKTRVKYKPEHFTWLALRLEGLSWAQIANRTEPLVGEDTVTKAVKRLARVLGVDIYRQS